MPAEDVIVLSCYRAIVHRAPCFHVHFLRKIHGHAGPTHCIWRNKDVSRYTSVLRGRT